MYVHMYNVNKLTLGPVAPGDPRSPVTYYEQKGTI